MKKLQEVRGFVAFVLHPPNGYLQPICTLVLALAVMSVGATTAREAENREMCARYMAFIGRDRDDPQRQAALWCIGIGFIFQTLGVVVALEVDPSVALPTANVGHPWWAMAALGEYLLVGGLWWGIATIAWDPELMDGPGPDANKA